MNTQNAKEYFKKASKVQRKSQAQKNIAFDLMPKIEGMTKVYMPFGRKGDGFYYIGDKTL